MAATNLNPRESYVLTKERIYDILARWNNIVNESHNPTIDKERIVLEDILTFGLIASILQIAASLISAPKQIKLLWKRKEATSHNVDFHLLPTLSSYFWVMHSIFDIWNPALMLATGLGAIMGTILASQVAYYRYILPGRIKLAMDP